MSQTNFYGRYSGITTETFKLAMFLILGYLLHHSDAIDSPTGLNRINLRTTSFEATWNQLPNVYYKVVVVRHGSTAPTSPPEGIDLATSPHLVTTTSSGENIQSSTKYSIYVFAIDPSDSSDFAQSNRSPTTAQEPPVDVKISNEMTNQFLVSWNSNNAHSSPHQTINYIVTYTTNGTSQTRKISWTQTQLTINGLASNTEYVVYVKKQSEYTDIFSDDSIPANGTTVPGVSLVSITRPSGPSADNTTMIEVGWNKPDGGDAIDNYTLEWRNESDARYFETIPHTSGTTSYTYMVGNLTPGSFYQFIVRSHNSAGNGDQSEPQELRLVPAKSWPPTLSQFQDDKISSLLVTWTKSSGISDAYQIKLYQGRYLRHNETTSQLSMLVSGLESGASYKATVTAISSHLYGSESESSSQIRTNPPTPLNVTLMQSSDEDDSTQLIISWNMPDGLLFHISSYHIIMRSSRGPLVIIPFDADKTNPMSYVVGGLTPGEIYTAIVQSVSPSDGPAATFSENSTMSNDVITKPSPPNYIAFVSFDEIQLNWNIVGYADGFIINFNCNQIVELIGSSYSYTFTKLKESSNYTIRMYSWVKDNHGNIHNSTSKIKLYTTLLKPEGQQSNPGLISGLVIMAILGILLIVGIYAYRRQNGQGKNKRMTSPSEYVTQIKNIPGQDKWNEFQKLPLCNADLSTSAAEQNQDKNRSNIFPYDKNRVKLVPILSEGSHDYINASFIQGNSFDKEYIATQGPLPKTMNEFWRMIWEQQSTCIVMLGDLVINGEVASGQYWPVDEVPIQMGNLVLNKTQNTVTNYWIHKIFILEKESKCRQVNQFQFLSWDDDNFDQDSIQALIEFTLKVREIIDKTRSEKPVVVHCSNGSGRTGTFIALDRLLQQYRQPNSDLGIYDVVRELRSNRMSMVENFEQYEMLYKSVKAFLAPKYEEVKPRNEYVNVGIQDGTEINLSGDLFHQVSPATYGESDYLELE
ncbi:unnamed protein product [Clavelina lepadiformis]|uniref:Protein-tyrosine-phosphatase n=1 Tax=Clavelina lepadiformis TaxID=159417 RepID=A0ABP0FY30_CLALP